MKIQINNQEIELSRDAFFKEGQRIIAAQIKGGTPAICELFDITPPTARKWKKRRQENFRIWERKFRFCFL